MRSRTQQPEAGSGRRKAFRIVAGVLGVAIVALSLPLTIQSFTDDAESIHRLHNLAGVFGFGLLLGGSLLVMARTPEAIGPFWVATASGVATTIAGVVSGDFISGIYYSAPLGIVILVALHPDRRALIDIRGFDLPTVVLALVALVPAVAFALTQSELQRNGFASDPHVEFHHYSGMASYALSIPLAAFAASFLVPGRRAAAWIVGVTALGLGLISLLLSDYPGAFDTLWAWLLIALAIAITEFAELSARRGRPVGAG
ncbi:MAG: hypothetical protein L0206_10555 [Actinobacteria bacterium]|nr:hypothetical protein [Actinomycetota bacterium]